MDLKERLKVDLKTAMKNRDNFKRDVIRFLNSAIKQIEVDERREVSSEDIEKIIQKSVKQREDAASQYKSAGREDLYEKEIKEANLLKEYLPKQLSNEELKEIIVEVIKEVGATSLKDMGRVMSLSLQKCSGRADGKRVNAIVKELL